MKFNQLSDWMEAKVMPIANKLSRQRHLRAIRDTFISLISVTLVGGLAAVLSAAPVTENTTNGFLLAWAGFAEANSLLLTWVNTVTLGAMSLYACIGITHFLSKHYKLDTLMPGLGGQVGRNQLL